MGLCCAVSVSAVDNNQNLFDGVMADDMGKMKAALNMGANINAVEKGSGQTPLMKACLMGKVSAVKFLLKKGADTSIGEKDGYTCMHGAGFQGRADVAKVLREHGL